MSMPDEAREELGRRQREFLDALNGPGAEAPGFAIARGFDAEQIERAGRALAGKRMRTVQKSWPALVNVLGAEFDEWFNRFAATCPSDEVDGAQFVRFLWRHADDPSLRLELCPIRAAVGFPLRFVINRAGVAMFIRLGRVRGWIRRRR